MVSVSAGASTNQGLGVRGERCPRIVDLGKWLVEDEVEGARFVALGHTLIQCGGAARSFLVPTLLCPSVRPLPIERFPYRCSCPGQPQ